MFLIFHSNCPMVRAACLSSRLASLPLGDPSQIGQDNTRITYQIHLKNRMVLKVTTRPAFPREKAEKDNCCHA